LIRELLRHLVHGGLARRVAPLASLIGALVLARAVDDPDLSQRILSSTKARLLSE